MNLALTTALMIVAGYLFGCAPYGVLIGALHGVDVTAAGSRNIGATNVGRLLGRKWGIIVFVLDVLKGAVPTLLAAIVFEDWCVAGEISPVAARLGVLAVGFAAVLGHSYSALLKFRGGRGVATSLGVCLGFFPDLTVPALAAFAVWGAVVAVSRYVSLASVAAAGVFPFLVVGWSLARGRRLIQDDCPLVAFTVLVGLLVIYRHRANLRRLAAGTEHKIGARQEPGRASASGDGA